MAEKTEKRIPNGDVTKTVKTFEKELKVLTTKAVEMGGELELQDKARFIAAAKILTETIEFYTKGWIDEIKLVDGFSADFIDLGRSVKLQEGGRMSEISSEAFDEMTIAEIKIAATLTEKGLKEAGRAELIASWKRETGRKAPSLTIKPLNK